jgi:hypothetical protein
MKERENGRQPCQAVLPTEGIAEKAIRMGSSNGVPGASGIVAIIVGTIVVSEIITEVTGTTIHWLFVIPGILMGLLAVKSINR